MDWAFLQRVELFPVRHHSPRASAVLDAFLEERRPDAVLVEGPSDATHLRELLCDPGTEPPVAILGYRTDGTPGSSLWPFASYSPEYRAALWATKRRLRFELIDIPIGVALAMHGKDEEDGLDRAPGADDAPAEDPSDEAAKRLGYRSFEEMWEATFEAPAYSAAQFRPALLAYAELTRLSSDRAYHRMRDAFMARRVGEVVASGVPPEKIVAVVGAAHASAFISMDVDASMESKLPAPVPSAATLIPYSFPRLAEQTGYGAGNRAPRYYQRAFDNGVDFHRATLEVLLEFAGHLRLRGFSASLADVLEAYRLASMLAQLREKTAPGLDELREATISTLCRGEAKHVDGFLWNAVVGRSVGKVAARVGKNSLQEEFWTEVKARKLPATDSPESFPLRLNNALEVGTSIFLHRLRVAEIPYASFQGAGRARPDDDAGGFAALTRVREGWTAQWTPSTDVALVEKIVLGETFEQVTTRILEEQLANATRTGEAAHVLVESVITSCRHTVSTALSACDRLAATDLDLPSLASAARALSGLVAYGTSRTRSELGDEAIEALLVKTFERAVLRTREACASNDEGLGAVLEALRTLNEVAVAQPKVSKGEWLAAAREVMDSYAVHPAASGLMTGLLYLGRELSESDLQRRVGQRLSTGVDPLQAAGFLEGFLQVNALALVKSRDVVAALDAYLCGIESARFKDALPVLRRALGALGATERRYLMENVVAVRGLKEQAKDVKTVMEEKDKEKLKTLSSDLTKAMDDLDDLL